MFKKERDLTERSRTLLKNKEVKKLKTTILQSFPGLTQESLDILIPNKCDITVVKLASRTLLYLKDFGSGDGEQAIFFDIEGRNNFYPTVLATWAVAEPVVPPLWCHCPVSEFVLNGADVMLPGCPIPRTLEWVRGEKRCVAGLGNGQPFAVGEMACEAADVERLGRRGKALRVVHHYGDALWAAFIRTAPNPGFQRGRVVALGGGGGGDGGGEEEEEAGEAPAGEAEGGGGAEEKAEGGGAGGEGLPPAPAPPAACGSGVLPPPSPGLEAGLAGLELSEAAAAAARETAAGKGAGEEEKLEEEGVNMDALLELTFFRAVKGALKDAQLPMLASTFFSSVLLPARPPGTEVNVKKTRWKKFGAFLAHMQAQGALTYAEREGVATLTGVNRDHEGYRACMLDAEERSRLRAAAGGAGGGGGGGGGAGGAGEEKRGFEVLNLYRIPSSITNLLGDAFLPPDGMPAGGLWRASEVRAALLAYAAAEGLEDPADRRCLRPNGPLTDACYKKKGGGPYPTSVPKDEILKVLLSKLQGHYALLLPGEDEPVVRRGRIQPVLIEVEKRQGNKHMTKVSGLETYGVDPDIYARDAQRVFASSSSTEDVPGKNSRAKIVLIQGHLANDVAENLTQTFQIPPKLIETKLGRGVKAKKKR